MKIAGGYQFALCEDGHLHLSILDENEEWVIELVLFDTDEIAEFAADLTAIIDGTFTAKAH